MLSPFGVSSVRLARLVRGFASSADVKKIAVIGAGQMGTGIGIVAARVAGCNVVMFDTKAEALTKSKDFAASWCAKEVSKGRMTEADKTSLLGHFSFANLKEEPKQLGDVDFVVEAVVENLAVKQDVFKYLDSHTRPEVILATNTSSISITKIAACTKRPEKVIGMHFMNPVPVMPLVEVIKGLATSAETLDLTLDLAKRMGKDAASALDRPGFVANRVLMPYINEAVFALQEGIATAEDIDKIMKLGTNVPMGPLTLADFIGLDTCLSIMRVLHEELGDSKYRPAPLLVQYVDAGWLGRKTKRGFYKY